PGWGTRPRQAAQVPDGGRDARGGACSARREDAGPTLSLGRGLGRGGGGGASSGGRARRGGGASCGSGSGAGTGALAAGGPADLPKGAPGQRHPARGGGEGRRLVFVLRGAQQRARVERRRADLVSTVAHELRAPLTSVEGFTATLLAKWGRFTDDQKKVMLET